MCLVYSPNCSATSPAMIAQAPARALRSPFPPHERQLGVGALSWDTPGESHFQRRLSRQPQPSPATAGASETCANAAKQRGVQSAASASDGFGMRATAADGAASTASGVGLLAYQHIMLALADPSPYFGDGSKQARGRKRPAVMRVLKTCQAFCHGL